MSADSDYVSRRHDDDRHYRRDRYHRDDRSRHYDYTRSRDRDSRDYDRGSRSKHRVPGLVSDPDTHHGDVDRAIQQGQRETVSRVKSGNVDYAKPSYNKSPTLDYRPPVTTVSKPYFPSYGVKEKKTSKRRAFYNASILAFFPGLVGFGLLIAAIVVPEWSIGIINNNSDVVFVYFGLFQICTFTLGNGITTTACQTLEEYATDGSVITDLEQATRGLTIISIIIAFIAIVVCVLFGLNRWERNRGNYISGAVLAFAGACAVAGMGCYSGFLANNQSEVARRWTVAGTSFFLGWCGAGFLLVASVTAFVSHCAKKRI